MSLSRSHWQHVELTTNGQDSVEALTATRQTWAVAEHCSTASGLSPFHRWETAVATQFIDLRADVKLFALPAAWRNSEEEKGRAFGVCTKENVVLTHVMVYTLDWPRLKFSTCFEGGTIAVESRLFFTLTVQWAQTALSCLALGSLLCDGRCSSEIATEGHLPWPAQHVWNQKYLW